MTYFADNRNSTPISLFIEAKPIKLYPIFEPSSPARINVSCDKFVKKKENKNLAFIYPAYGNATKIFHHSLLLSFLESLHVIIKIHSNMWRKIAIRDKQCQLPKLSLTFWLTVINQAAASSSVQLPASECDGGKSRTRSHESTQIWNVLETR